MTYEVFQCRNCGFPGIARSTQKTSQCRACNKQNDLGRVRILHRTENMVEAREALKIVKCKPRTFNIDFHRIDLARLPK